MRGELLLVALAIRCRLSAHDIAGLFARWAFGDREFYWLAFFKVAITFAGNRGIMHKNIGTAFLRDESETLLRAEPLSANC